MHQLPADMFQLFVVSGIYASRLGDTLGALHILFVSVLTTAFVLGWLRLKPRKLISFSVFSMGVWLLVLVSTRGLLSHRIENTYDRANLLEGMHASVVAMEAAVHRTKPDPDPGLQGLSVAERLEKTGILRVGYDHHNLPFTFFNDSGELVGMDVDSAYRLAQDLGVRLEFVPALWDEASLELGAGLYDVLMSSIIIPSRLQKMGFSDPYMEITVGLLVPDHKRNMVETRMERGDFSGLTLGIPISDTESHIFDRLMPGAERRTVLDIEDYLESGGDGLDGCVWSVESGAAWTLVYPAFSVVPIVPHQKSPVVYATALDQEEFQQTLNGWLHAFKTSGELDRLYSYWVLGQGTEERKPRWCCVRDVLGWVE